MSERLTNIVYNAGRTLKLTPSAYSCLHAIAWEADDNGQTDCTASAIAEMAGVSPRAGDDAFAVLQKAGLLRSRRSPVALNTAELIKRQIGAPSHAKSALAKREICASEHAKSAPQKRQNCAPYTYIKNNTYMNNVTWDEREQRFFDVFPKKPRDVESFREHFEETLQAVDLDTLIECARKAVQDIRAQNNGSAQYLKKPEIWLDNKCWLDYLSQHPQPATTSAEIDANFDAFWNNF